jgi:SSS family solute:Na+ symporter
MNLHFLDWLMVLAPLGLVLFIAARTRKYTKSVAAFMAADRIAGRYLVATASGEASFGAIAAVAAFEQFFVAGFNLSWWLQANNAVWLFILLSGFIIYRYRESRVMTMAQFFEIRYSKAFRLFAGFLVFASGLLAYGIYPAVGGRFFVYFCGFPDTLHIGSLAIPTYALVMGLLLLPGVMLTCVGGQLTLMVVDCVEGLISLVFYMFVAVALMLMFSWTRISESMLDRPQGQSLFNPFNTSATQDFNMWFMIIAIFVAAYGWQSSQAGHGFRSAAFSAHEQKMGAILGPWRNEAKTLMLTILSICAYCFLHHSHFSGGAAAVQEALRHIDNPALRTQMEVPTALGLMLPIVIKGMFASIMLFALISTDATMMHSWGTILVQDLIVPLRKQPMETKQHLLVLRLAVVGVALFAFLFSLFFKQTQYINMFFAFAGALFSGAGAVIIGGFYWKKGTTAGAWGAMIGGVVVSVAGIILQQNWKDSVYPWLAVNSPGFLSGFRYFCEDVLSKNIYSLNWVVGPEKFPFSGQWVLLFATLASIVLYLGLSLLTSRKEFNLDRMLHRGQWAIQNEEHVASTDVPRKFSWKLLLGITPEFTKSDMTISLSLFIYRFAWFVIFAVITTWNILRPWPEQWWVNFFHATSVALPFAIGIIVTVWFTWGGLRDLKKLFIRLETVTENPLDDGTVVGHHNLDEDPVLAKQPPKADAH